MSDSDAVAARELPARPSKEHLRKQAKRLAARRSLGLAAAQRQLAREYGAPSWAALMRRVDLARDRDPLPPLAPAARAGDVAGVRRLLAAGHPPSGRHGAGGAGTPLWHACAGPASDGDRLAVAEALLAAGANPHRGGPGGGPLHAAAVRGPLALVELLIRHGAREWELDGRGRTPLDLVRQAAAADQSAAGPGPAGPGPAGADRAAIAELLDRPVIRDPAFRAAVAAVQRGDVRDLERLLDAEPRLLRERIVEPSCYRQCPRPSYFTDPKLFWFVANNPILVARMPAGTIDVAAAMVARGVGQSDLDYTLELVMTGSAAREAGLQLRLLEVLLAAGATPTPAAVAATLAHREVEPVEALLARGHPLTAPIAAATGRTGPLAGLLREARPEEVQLALAVAVVNDRVEAARLALDAGADPDAYLPVHQHSTPLHQAVLHDDVRLLELLVGRGARTDRRDRSWDATAHDWAVHEHKARAAAYLAELPPARQEAREQQPPESG